MVFNVRCFKCGEHEVRLVLGGRAIIHARCHGCESNLLAEIMELEQEVSSRQFGDDIVADDDLDQNSPEDTVTPSVSGEEQLQASGQ